MSNENKQCVKRLSLPSLPPAVVYRQEIDIALDRAWQKTLVYVHAPAGFGKTVAVNLWLSKKHFPIAWIPLGAYDNSPAAFCRYIMTAISSFDRKAARFIEDALSIPEFDAAPFEYMFHSLSHIGNDTEHAVFALDDFHLIENESIIKAMPQIIKKLPDGWKFVVISRSVPPSAFADLILKEHVGFIAEKDLRFTREQVIKLYKNYGLKLNSAELASIEEMSGGWALGLKVRLLASQHEKNGEAHSEANFGEQYINQYLKTEIWDNFDNETKTFLMKTSMLDDISIELCDKLCETKSRDILIKLMNESGLITQLSTNVFCYHHIFRDFLRALAESENYDLSQAYIVAGGWMSEHGRFPIALDFYIKSENVDALNGFLRYMADFNITDTGVEDYFISFQNLIMKKLPPELLEENFLFVQDCAFTSFLGGDLEQLLFWLLRLDRLITNGKICEPQFLGVAYLLQYINPLADPWEFTQPIGIEETPLDNTPSISLTMNLPFFHRSHRDYSQIVDRFEEFLPLLRDNSSVVIGANAGIFLDGVAAGILYEQNKLKRASEYAIDIFSRLKPQLPPEMWFSVSMHLAAIFIAQGEMDKADEIMDKVREMIKNQNALYLNANLNALLTNYKLYSGDVEAAKEWLNSYMVGQMERVTLHQSYQAMTTARALITTGDFSSAILLLAKIKRFADDFRRPLDLIEAMILKSITLWKLKNRHEAVTQMEEATVIAEKYGYIRLFANEGAEVVPILQKVVNRADSGRIDTMKDSNFVRGLLLAAYENAKSSPGLTSELKPEPVKLSKQQKLMLALLSQNKNNRQICEETGLKLNTVKSHLYKLYEKLEVNSAADAVIKAKELEIIE